MMKLVKASEIRKAFDDIRLDDVLCIDTQEYQEDFIGYVAEKVHRDGYL